MAAYGRSGGEWLDGRSRRLQSLSPSTEGAKQMKRLVEWRRFAEADYPVWSRVPRHAGAWLIYADVLTPFWVSCYWEDA